ncbi:MAG: preprotein translocase subunit SecY [Hyphomicrobiaceae bacterium]
MREETTQSPPGAVTLRQRWSPQLLGKLLFAAGVLLIVRFGQWIPLPGLDIHELLTLLERRDLAPYGLIYTPDIISHVSIFALGLWPFLYAWIAIQLLGGGTPPQGYTSFRRWLTLLIAVFMALQVTSDITSTTGLVREPGAFFGVVVVITLSAGTMLLLWLGEQITKTGLCDGIWLIVAAEFIARVPTGAIEAWHMYLWGVIPLSRMLILAVLLVSATVLIVLMVSATRRVPTVSLENGAEQRDTDLTLRLDYATIMPAVLASMVLAGAIAAIQKLHAKIGDQAFIIIAYLGPGQAIHLLIYAVSIVTLTFLITSRAASPQASIARLAEDGRMIAECPKKEAEAHLRGIVSRMTIITATYLLTIGLLPELLMRIAKTPLYLDGVSMMIVVIVMLDIQKRATAQKAAGVGHV